MNTDPTILGTNSDDPKWVGQEIESEGFHSFADEYKLKEMNSDSILQLTAWILYDSHGWKYCGDDQNTPIFDVMIGLKPAIDKAIADQLDQETLNQWIRPDMRRFFVRDLKLKWERFKISTTPTSYNLLRLNDYQ